MEAQLPAIALRPGGIRLGGNIHSDQQIATGTVVDPVEAELQVSLV